MKDASSASCQRIFEWISTGQVPDLFNKSSQVLQWTPDPSNMEMFFRCFILTYLRTQIPTKSNTRGSPA
jgi:hypothetical protein